jgi:simple sugar transport system ATP-binding protein
MQKLSLRALTKTFSGVRAVDRVTLEFHAGEIHAILGENGAGKSTLMHLVSGLYRPDSGEICIDDRPHLFSSARIARTAGIAMVHQHFMLIPPLTVAENILLALPGSAREIIRVPELARRVADLASQYGVTLEDPNARVANLSVGAQQRVEILKALATNARVLILDEPTAVLTPNEVENLFSSLRKLKQNGYLILFITHKIPEVLAVSDRLSILRGGRLITTRETSSCSPTDLANLMMEDSTSALPRAFATNANLTEQQSVSSFPLLTLNKISLTISQARMVLHQISFTLHHGEIIGIAGVDGNGQSELAEVLIGIRTPAEGTLALKGKCLHKPTPADLRAAGIAIIPQDRRREGLALNLSVAENLLLNVALLSRLALGVMLRSTVVRAFAERCITRFSIVPSAPSRPAATLSGGNQQRIVLARELSTSPQVVIAVNPSRGLDISATQYIHQQLQERRTEGSGIILISTDLDEILSLSDRIFVLYQGRLLGPVAPTTSKETLGQMMAGVWRATS